MNPQKQWHCGDFVNFLANGAVAGKNFKNLDKYWEIWYSVLYGMQEIRWINFNMGCIETDEPTQIKVKPNMINFNMGCIETDTHIS